MARRSPIVHHVQPIPGDRSDPAALAPLADDYLAWLRARRYSDQTVITRRHALWWFCDWCTQRDLSHPLHVTKPVLDRYLRSTAAHRKRDGQPLSPRAQHARLDAVRRFFHWLVKHDYLPANPAADLELPRLPHRLPRAVLSEPEAEAVFAAVDLSSPLGLRDRAMLELFYSTGLRRRELVNLLVPDLNLARRVLFVREGKGARDRYLPVGHRACAWVHKYLADARPALVSLPDPHVLFLSHRGQALTPGMLTRLVAQYFTAAGLPGIGSCHVFRHTCATLMLEGGADVRFVQEMLGHSNLETTQIYTRVSIRQLQAVHAATHPANRQRPALDDDPVQTAADDLLAFLDAD